MGIDVSNAVAFADDKTAPAAIQFSTTTVDPTVTNTSTSFTTQPDEGNWFKKTGKAFNDWLKKGRKANKETGTAVCIFGPNMAQSLKYQPFESLSQYLPILLIIFSLLLL